MPQTTVEFERAARRRRHINDWITTFGRVLALAMLVAMGSVWLVTGRVEPLLVATFGGMFSVAAGVDALIQLRRPDPTPPPVPDKTVGGPEVSA